MRDLQDNNETLFYSLIAHNIEELLPIVYTPAVGEGCQRFSEIWRKPRGLFLSYPNKERIEQILANPSYDFSALHRGQRRRAHPRSRRSGRRAAWAFPSARWRFTPRWAAFRRSIACPCCSTWAPTTKRCSMIPIYIGWEHKRIRGQEYDDFVEAFVTAVERRWPHVLIAMGGFRGRQCGAAAGAIS